mmetsp:Transcript_38796/g.66578  ORF Transcript_38796/g.66578 Transcript_38796/m.66578 type:complete len:107 (-) Transcript_38796:78-398(-)
MPRKRRSSNTSGGNPRKARKVYAKDTPETQVYEVEQILGRRDKDGVEEFLIKWRNYSYKENTWEPIDNLVGCNAAMKAFKERPVARRSIPLAQNSNESESSEDESS